MAVLMEFAIFPTDKGISVSNDVSKVINMLRNSGYEHQLTAMGTLVETDTIEQAMGIISEAANLLGKNSNRIYSSINLDIKKGASNMLQTKVKSIEDKLK